jgi:hypothetical protein
MKTTKLIRYLGSLTPEELKSLERFINSRFFNRNKSILKLFEYLKTSKFKFELLYHRKEEIYRYITGKSDFRNQKIHNLYSDTIKLIELFFSVKRFISNEKEVSINLLSEILGRNLTSDYHTMFRKYEKEFIRVTDNDIENLYYKIKILSLNHESKQWDYLYKNNRLTENKEIIENLNKILDYLHKFYNLFRFKLYSDIRMYELLNNEGQFDKESSLNDLGLNSLELSNCSYLTRIYLNLFKVYQKNVPNKYLDEILTMLDKYRNEIKPTVIFEIYTKLENYCIFMIQAGNDEYIPILFNLYNKSFELKDLQYVEPMIFINAVTTAINLNKLDWAYDFNEKFRTKVFPQESENAYYLNRAKICFYLKNYDECLEFLNKVKLNNIFIKLVSKSLYIMVFYELNDVERFEHAIDAFRHFLKRNKLVPNNMRIMGYKFINYSAKLMKAKINNDSYGIDTIELEIINSITANKKWLLDKINEIKAFSTLYRKQMYPTS